MFQGPSHAPIGKIFCRASKLISERAPSWALLDLLNISEGFSVLSVRFDVGVSLLLAPARADKRGLGTPFPLVPRVCRIARDYLPELWREPGLTESTGFWKKVSFSSWAIKY